MDWTGLNRALAKQVVASDCVVFYCHDPDETSLGKMTALAGDTERIRVGAAFAARGRLDEFAKNLDTSCVGTIFLISDETDRLVVDPGSVLIKTLEANRLVSRQRDGRNLVLYAFMRKLDRS